MNNLLILGYEVAADLIPFFIGLLILNWIYKKTINKTMNAKHIVGLGVFAIYMIGVFHFTGAGTIWDAMRYHFEIKSWQINLVPFSNDIDAAAYLLNILLFIPLGFLLPYMNTKMNSAKYAVMIGMLFSLIIELSQLLNNRSTDIDDLMLNTFGAAIGYGVFKVAIRVCKTGLNNTDYYKYEAVVFMAVMLLGRFLLYDEFKLARLLYGF